MLCTFAASNDKEAKQLMIHYLENEGLTELSREFVALLAANNSPIINRSLIALLLAQPESQVTTWQIAKFRLGIIWDFDLAVESNEGQMAQKFLSALGHIYTKLPEDSYKYHAKFCLRFLQEMGAGPVWEYYSTQYIRLSLSDWRLYHVPQLIEFTERFYNFARVSYPEPFLQAKINILLRRNHPSREAFGPFLSA